MIKEGEVYVPSPRDKSPETIQEFIEGQFKDENVLYDKYQIKGRITYLRKVLAEWKEEMVEEQTNLANWLKINLEKEESDIILYLGVEYLKLSRDQQLITNIFGPVWLLITFLVSYKVIVWICCTPTSKEK